VYFQAVQIKRNGKESTFVDIRQVSARQVPAKAAAAQKRLSTAIS
jgi:hypothetical protein